MCGITGFNWQDKELIQKMTREVAHRGPDDSGIYTDRHFSLGHRRLSIVDLSENGHQPMFNEDQTIVLVYNGEIYNFKSIRTELEKKGHKFASNTDSEVIIHGYEEYGEGVLSLLDGKFAFAIWDSKKRKALLARDRIGVKPLYYFISNNKFLFSSEIKSILIHDSIKRKINYQCLSNYLSLRFSSGEETMFQGIKKLLPGNYLVYQNYKIRIKPYWIFPKFTKTSDPDISKIDKLIKSAIAKRLMADVPIGVFLSGGLDSSTIVAYLSQLTNDIRTFSIGFNDATDELNDAKIIADNFNTKHTEIISDADSLSYLPRIVWHMDEPMADPASLPTYILSEQVSKKVKVVLAGEGGDEVFGGYQVFNYADPLENVIKIPKFFRKNILSPVSKFSSGLFKYPNKQILKLGAEILKEDDLKKAYLKLFYRPFELEDKESLLLKNQKKNIILKTALDDSIEKNADLKTGALSYFFKEYLPNDLLIKADKMGLAHALEIRVPFLDTGLVEYSCGLDNIYKKNRFIFRKTVSHLLPRSTLKKKKQGFTLPLSNWFIKKEFLDRTSNHFEDLSKRRLFDDFYYKKIVANPAEFRNDHRMWVLLNLELWLKIYLDKIDYKKISI